jgi:hypothetical protein
MAPPSFKDLGKKAGDLFKKSYDYKNEIKVVSKADGVKLENGGVSGKALVGYTKANWTDQYLGDIEVEAHSCGLAKGQFKLKKVADLADITVAGGACGGLSVEASFAQDNITAQAKVAHNLNKGFKGLTSSAVFGFDGVSVGGSVALDASGAPTDYNLGAQYSQKDLTAALVTSSKGDNITVSFFQTYSAATTLGASMLVKPEDGSRLFTFGTEHKLDSNTTVKGKATSTGVVGTSVTHVLANPSMKVVVSAEFDATGSDITKAQKFGIGLNFGDF